MKKKAYKKALYFLNLLIILLISALLYIVAVEFGLFKDDSISSESEKTTLEQQTNQKDQIKQEEQAKPEESSQVNKQIQPENQIIPEVENKKIITPITSNITNKVPFTSQAPYWEWSNDIYEEWCEEASIIMAVYWTKWEELTKEIADTEMKNISNFEKKTLWTYLDTSLQDVWTVLKDYFSFNKFKIKESITKNDIIDSLNSGNILLVPVYWRDLDNPNYNSPWPTEHMVVVIWYNPLDKEFITHDPWTRNWKWFKYNEDVLFNAIWAYPTSDKKLDAPSNSNETRKKSMMEIYK